MNAIPDIIETISRLNGSPDNREARGILTALAQAGLFIPSDDMLSLGRLEVGGKQFQVLREADIWQTVKIWQINVVPLN